MKIKQSFINGVKFKTYNNNKINKTIIIIIKR